MDCYVADGYWDQGYTEQDVCSVGPPNVARGDDAFRSNGQRERFWRERAEREFEALLSRAEAVAEAPRKARQRVVEEFALVKWARLPEARRVRDLLASLKSDEPDHTHVAALVLAIREEIRIQRRRKRDVEALMVLAA